jgi:type III secretion system low calcium response chaperone LcrH/SycD
MGKRPELAETGKTAERYKFSPSVEQDVLTVIRKILPTTLRASDAKLEEFYAKGLNKYKAGQYKEALPYFKLLITAHPKEPRYVMAVAACFHMLKKYTDAAKLYTASSFLDPENPIPQYHLADCCIHLNNPIGAFIALEMALKRCKTSVGHKALQERIEMLLEGMKKDFEEKKKEGFSYFQSDPEVEKVIKSRLNKKKAA